MNDEKREIIGETAELLELRTKQVKADEEIEVLRYNNNRLSKRLEEVIQQLKDNVTLEFLFRLPKDAPKKVGLVQEDSLVPFLVVYQIRRLQSSYHRRQL